MAGTGRGEYGDVAVTRRGASGDRLRVKSRMSWVWCRLGFLISARHGSHLGEFFNLRCPQLSSRYIRTLYFWYAQGGRAWISTQTHVIIKLSIVRGGGMVALMVAYPRNTPRNGGDVQVWVQMGIHVQPSNEFNVHNLHY